MTKFYWYKLTENEADFLDIALQWMDQGLHRELKEPYHHLERALRAVRQKVMLDHMMKKLHNPDKEEQ